MEDEVFSWSASSSFLLVGFVSSGSYSYPSRHLSGKWRDNLINAISNPERLK